MKEIIKSSTMMLVRLILFSCLSLYANASEALGSGGYSVICAADGNQFEVKLIKGLDGYIAVWQDERRGSPYRDIYGQKFNVDADIQWTRNGRVIAEAQEGELDYAHQNRHHIADDDTGGTFILWTDSDPGYISNDNWATHVSPDAVVQWGNPGLPIQGSDTAVCIAEVDYTMPSAVALTPDGEGGAFASYCDGMYGHWKIVRYDANGVMRTNHWPSWQYRGGTAQMIYAGASEGKDSVIIAWGYGELKMIKVEDPETVYPGGLDDLTSVWGPITLSPVTIWYEPFSLIPDGNGGAIVAWVDDRNGNNTFDLFVQKINADGSLAWPENGVEICAAEGWQRYPHLVSDGAGGAVIVWQDQRSGSQAYAQYIDFNGDVQWTAGGIVLSQRAGEAPQVMKSSDGNYIVVWADYDHNGGTPDYISAQKITPGGLPLWTPGGTVVTGMGGPWDFQIASDNDGGVMVVWAWGDIYVQRVFSDGSLPPLRVRPES